MKHPPISHEFTAQEIVGLLNDLDSRLKKRRSSGSIFIVGGAAIAVTTGEGPRRTEDVDVITQDLAVLEEAQAMAKDRGLPSNWLNNSATMWMPPLPAAALARGGQAGLNVTYANDEFLFATKLVAQRRKDAGDLELLARRLGRIKPSPADLEAIIRKYYTDQGALEFILDGNDVDGEIRLLAERAARMLARSTS